jgi:hypothetical protein
MAVLFKKGHKSPYEMTYAEFKSMALDHVRVSDWWGFSRSKERHSDMTKESSG